jgi:16S rRNA processing protein RimM
MPDLCLIANIVAVHGVAGALKLRSQSDVPGRFSRLDTVLVGPDPAHVRSLRITDARELGDRVIVQFEGLPDRDAAEELVGLNMYVTGEQMESPPEGRYFVHDLIGCAVRTPEGEDRGAIVDVMLLPANDVYVVMFEEREILVPAVPEFIRDVNVQEKRVTVEPVPGLFEEEDED